MRSGHGNQVDWVAIFSHGSLAVALVVSEAVFDTDNDPKGEVSYVATSPDHISYHKFVKTTPKPRATKNSRGELVGPPPPLELEAALVVATGELEVVVADIVKGLEYFPAN